jgi:hypothetical protein
MLHAPGISQFETPDLMQAISFDLVTLNRARCNFRQSTAYKRIALHKRSV